MEATKTLIFGREPVLIMGLIEALIGTVVVFGLDLTTAQTTSILMLAGAVLTVIARQSVTPTAKLADDETAIDDEEDITPRIVENRAPRR